MRDIETNDIVLAAYLKINRYSLDRIHLKERRGVFTFSNVDDQALTDYDLGKATVEPKQFNDTLKTLVTAARRIINA